MLTTIAFDVSDDGARRRVVLRLREVARRVQKSVFEAADLRGGDLVRLRRDLEEIIDPRTDSVRYYPICAACAGRIEISGQGDSTRVEEFVIV